MFKKKKKTKSADVEEKEDQSQAHSRTQSAVSETKSDEMKRRTSSATAAASGDEEKTGDHSDENSSVAATESVIDPYSNDPTTWVEPEDSEDEDDDDALHPVSLPFSAVDALEFSNTHEIFQDLPFPPNLNDRICKNHRKAPTQERAVRHITSTYCFQRNSTLHYACACMQAHIHTCAHRFTHTHTRIRKYETQSERDTQKCILSLSLSLSLSLYKHAHTQKIYVCMLVHYVCMLVHTQTQTQMHFVCLCGSIFTIVCM
jgi:hypothetical protein